MSTHNQLQASSITFSPEKGSAVFNRANILGDYVSEMPDYAEVHKAIHRKKKVRAAVLIFSSVLMASIALMILLRVAAGLKF